MRIRRWKSKKQYLGNKGVYGYERFYVDIPAKFRNAVEPFLNQDLDVDVRKKGDDKLVIVAAPRKNFRGPEKPP